MESGTPARIDGRTIDYSKIEKKYPDYPPVPFSFMNNQVWLKPEEQLITYMTFTNSEVARIVRDNIHLSKHVKEETRGPR